MAHGTWVDTWQNTGCDYTIWAQYWLIEGSYLKYYITIIVNGN